MKKSSVLAMLLMASLAGCDDTSSHDPDGGPSGSDDAGLDAGTRDAGDPDEDAGTDAGDVDAQVAIGPECSSTVPSGAGAKWVQLCDVDGPVQHVRIAGVVAPNTHASAQLFLGFDAQPTDPQGAIGADQFKLQLYGGGNPAPSPQLDAYFGTHDATIAGTHAFINSPSTICFDVHDGSNDAPPYFVIWRDGVNGADCEDFDTLTLATAYGMELSYDGAVGAIAKDKNAYFYQAAGVSATPVITLFTTPALTVEETLEARTCETTWQANTDWQQLCQPLAGVGRHYVIENASSPNANKYFYLVVGQDPSPTGNPTTADGDGRFIFTGGRANGGGSWTYFRFDGSSSTQYTYSAGEPAAELYTTQPNTVCFDVGTQSASTNVRVLFWATGAGGADCADASTLNAANALYDSTTSGDTFWTSARAEGKLDFIKVSGTDPATSATLGRVTVSTELAVP